MGSNSLSAEAAAFSSYPKEPTTKNAHWHESHQTPDTNRPYFQLTVEEPALLHKSLTRHNQNTSRGNKSLPPKVKLPFDHSGHQGIITRQKTPQQGASR